MIFLVSLFFTVALIFYVLFAGADFGAGVLEMVKGRSRREDQSELIGKAMGPVWEANHIWLILMVVILFMGFPPIFRVMSISLHIPIVMVLVGIILRGTAFTFRHYDAVQDGSQKIYTILFSTSSVWTSFWLGVVAAAMHRGMITTGSKDFNEAFVAPWGGMYPFTFGLFVMCVFTFLASAYLIGETKDAELRKIFRARAIVFNLLTVVLGALVFLTAELEGHGITKKFFTQPWSLTAFILATLMLVPLWISIYRGRTYAVRVLAGGLITLVLLGWIAVVYPDVLITREGPLTFTNSSAVPAVMKQLAIALIVGICLIFPSLIWLLRVFK
jgi:Cytochrome bd-type quinol oxidase, subunit 2